MKEARHPNSLKRLRQERTGYSQKAFAKLCGWSEPQQGKLERGERELKQRQINEILKHLKSSPDELLAPDIRAATPDRKLYPKKLNVINPGKQVRINDIPSDSLVESLHTSSRGETAEGGMRVRKMDLCKTIMGLPDSQFEDAAELIVRILEEAQQSGENPSKRQRT